MHDKMMVRSSRFLRLLSNQVPHKTVSSLSICQNPFLSYFLLLCPTIQVNQRVDDNGFLSGLSG